MIADPNTGERLTPTKAAKKLIYESIHGLLENGVLEETIDNDYYDTTDMERANILVQTRKCCERIMKSL